MPNTYSSSSSLPLSGGTLTGDLTLGPGIDITLASNGLVDGKNVSALSNLQFKDGLYTGDGENSRSVNIGVNLNAASNVFVIVKSNGAYKALFISDCFKASNAAPFDAGIPPANKITSFDATGFVVDAADECNLNFETYRYFVFYGD